MLVVLLLTLTRVMFAGLRQNVGLFWLWEQSLRVWEWIDPSTEYNFESSNETFSILKHLGSVHEHITLPFTITYLEYWNGSTPIYSKKTFWSVNRSSTFKGIESEIQIVFLAIKIKVKVFASYKIHPRVDLKSAYSHSWQPSPTIWLLSPLLSSFVHLPPSALVSLVNCVITPHLMWYFIGWYYGPKLVLTL